MHIIHWHRYVRNVTHDFLHTRFIQLYLSMKQLAFHILMQTWTILLFLSSIQFIYLIWFNSIYRISQFITLLNNVIIFSYFFSTISPIKISMKKKSIQLNKIWSTYSGVSNPKFSSIKQLSKRTISIHYYLFFLSLEGSLDSHLTLRSREGERKEEFPKVE